MTTGVPNRDELIGAVATAIQAPSVHNTQPWLFRLGDGTVDVFADPARRLAVSDPDGRALRVSCGAAVFNLRLAIHQLGYVPSVRLATGPLAAVGVAGRRPPNPRETQLYEAIPRRHSNRLPFLDTAVPLSVRAELAAAAEAEGAWLHFVLGQVALDTVAELVREADEILVRDDAYRAELLAWRRTEPGSVDGVPVTAGGPSPEPQDLLTRRDFGGPARKPGLDFEADPLVAVLGGLSDSSIDDLVAGQALQRVLLTATDRGLATSLMSQPVEVPQVREQLRLGLRRYGSPQVLLRFGHGVPTQSTPRRPVADVLLPDGERVGVFRPSPGVRASG